MIIFFYMGEIEGLDSWNYFLIERGNKYKVGIKMGLVFFIVRIFFIEWVICIMIVFRCKLYKLNCFRSLKMRGENLG